MPDLPQITITLDGPTPIYRQIADAIRTHCVSGALGPGTKLPTVRQLAAALGVHFNTVAEAYRTLADEGWLSIEGRRGVTILDRATPHSPNSEAHGVESSRLHHLIAALRAKGFSAEWIRHEVHAALTPTSETQTEHPK